MKCFTSGGNISSVQETHIHLVRKVNPQKCQKGRIKNFAIKQHFHTKYYAQKTEYTKILTSCKIRNCLSLTFHRDLTETATYEYLKTG